MFWACPGQNAHSLDFTRERFFFSQSDNDNAVIYLRGTFRSSKLARANIFRAFNFGRKTTYHLPVGIYMVIHLFPSRRRGMTRNICSKSLRSEKWNFSLQTMIQTKQSIKVKWKYCSVEPVRVASSFTYICGFHMPIAKDLSLNLLSAAAKSSETFGPPGTVYST